MKVWSSAMAGKARGVTGKEGEWRFSASETFQAEDEVAMGLKWLLEFLSVLNIAELL